MGGKGNFKVEVLGPSKAGDIKDGRTAWPSTRAVLTQRHLQKWNGNPKTLHNKKPIVLVGKGVVYDTGGLSLKPTANSMDIMKCDMGGAAAVSCAIYAIAKAKLPIHVVGLGSCNGQPARRKRLCARGRCNHV